jgi:hypothetical protein
MSRRSYEYRKFKKKVDLAKKEENADPYNEDSIRYNFGQAVKSALTRQSRWTNERDLADIYKKHTGSPFRGPMQAGHHIYNFSFSSESEPLFVVEPDNPDFETVCQLIVEQDRLKEFGTKVAFFASGLLAWPVNTRQLSAVLPKEIVAKLPVALKAQIDIQQRPLNSNEQFAFRSYVKSMKPIIDEIKEENFTQIMLT